MSYHKSTCPPSLGRKLLPLCLRTRKEGHGNGLPLYSRSGHIYIYIYLYLYPSLIFNGWNVAILNYWRKVVTSSAPLPDFFPGHFTSFLALSLCRFVFGLPKKNMGINTEKEDLFLSYLFRTDSFNEACCCVNHDFLLRSELAIQYGTLQKTANRSARFNEHRPV